MTFMELAQNRFSERHFDPRPVEDEKLQQILEAGRIAPTACNYQPQRIYVLKSPEALEKARMTKASLYSCPLVLLVCYDSEIVWKILLIAAMSFITPVSRMRASLRQA